MSTYHSLSVGDSFTTPSRVVDDALVHTLISLGGYTHPLFTDPAFAAASPFGRTPMPGEGVLHLMGGLAESSGRFDDTVIALVGFDDVRFLAPAFAGDELRVIVSVLSKEPRPDGARGILVMSWRCLNSSDVLVVEAVARMLFRIS